MKRDDIKKSKLEKYQGDSGLQIYFCVHRVLTLVYMCSGMKSNLDYKSADELVESLNLFCYRRFEAGSNISKCGRYDDNMAAYRVRKVLDAFNRVCVASSFDDCGSVVSASMHLRSYVYSLYHGRK